MRPATPGFLVTLLATILLAVVSFSVPWFRSVFFLKASLSVEGIDGSITFGVLGYCLELNNGTTCSKPSIGYELDINQLVGDRTRLQIPQVVVKWLTYALVLHIVALVLAAISSFFGLLAHVREFSMTCFSTCISGLGATTALLAFIFDLALFFLAKSRLNSVKGGSATMGNAIWLTLVAWVLLFFAGCFYGLGRCCIRRRPRDMTPANGGGWVPANSTSSTFDNQMRLDAVKAEADRNARQNQPEQGLPAFPEYQRLPVDNEAEAESYTPYRDRQYAAAPVGTRAVDEYNTAGNSAYPPRRQQTALSASTQQSGYAHSQQTSGYAASTYARNTTPAVPGGYTDVDNTTSQPDLATRYRRDQYASNDGYAPGQYGDGNVGQSTFSAYNTSTAARGAQDASGMDPFQAYTTPQTQTPFNPSTYNATARLSPPSQSRISASYYTPQVQSSLTSPTQSRSYTLSGSGYGENTVPSLPDHRASDTSAGYLPYPGEVMTPSSGSAYTAVDDPRGFHESRSSPYEDSPPTYDEGIGASALHPVVTSGKR